MSVFGVGVGVEVEVEVEVAFAIKLDIVVFLSSALDLIKRCLLKARTNCETSCSFVVVLCCCRSSFTCFSNASGMPGAVRRFFRRKFFNSLLSCDNGIQVS